MKKLIIVGAGGFGRETLYLALEINKITPNWEILGFIDDNEKALDGIRCEYKIIGKISAWEPNENEVFAMGIASPKAKEIISEKLISKGAQFVSLIHPNAVIQPFTNIGVGCVIGGRSTIGDNATIGKFVHIAGSMVGQDSVIGDYSTTTGFANIASAKIGKRVFVGSHAVILNHLVVEDDAFICAGSIVLSKVRANTKVLGYPAKKLSI